ncbi:hydroxyacylglutathione hydrolase [mine drainage metagenome]|uniref:hydroxyacylglutathione hydrolase n=1 Tax=mine drainage metagenome TaxID=410659 RepID=A0A1J5R898_9ZZZZ
MIVDGGLALVVDPGDAAVVQRACAAAELDLAGILVTHHHHDHVGGIAALCAQRALPVWAPAAEDIAHRTHAVRDGETVRVPGFALEFRVIEVPGHTLGHVAYYAEPAGADPVLLCGDTLFAAGCGRLFEGTPQQMYASLQRLAALPEATRVYCAHEYTLSNLQFAARVEPGNAELRSWTAACMRRREAGEPTLPSSIGQERRVNPFLRVDEPEVRASLLTQRGRVPRDSVDAFAALRQWKDES